MQTVDHHIAIGCILYDIPMIVLMMLMSDSQSLAYKTWVPRDFHVDDFIHLFDTVIRQPKSIYNLYQGGPGI